MFKSLVINEASRKRLRRGQVSTKRRHREQAIIESPARNESAEWTSELQSEIHLMVREKYPRRVAPVIELEHEVNVRALSE